MLLTEVVEHYLLFVKKASVTFPWLEGECLSSGLYFIAVKGPGNYRKAVERYKLIIGEDAYDNAIASINKIGLVMSPDKRALQEHLMQLVISDLRLLDEHLRRQDHQLDNQYDWHKHIACTLLSWRDLAGRYQHRIMAPHEVPHCRRKLYDAYYDNPFIFPR